MDIFISDNITTFAVETTATKINMLKKMLCILRDLRQSNELRLLFGSTLGMHFEFRNERMPINALTFERNRIKVVCNSVCFRLEESDNTEYLEMLYDIVHHVIIDVLIDKGIIKARYRRYKIMLQHSAIHVDDIILS